MWSMNAETRSVGPLQPLAMGVIPWGFFEKVHTLCPDFLCQLEKGMGMLIYVARFFHAVY